VVPPLLTWRCLWGLHHLDYPSFVPAYLGALGILSRHPAGPCVGAGILLLVLDDLRRGLGALSALSGDLQWPGGSRCARALLARPLTWLRSGSALFSIEDRASAWSVVRSARHRRHLWTNGRLSSADVTRRCRRAYPVDRRPGGPQLP